MKNSKKRPDPGILKTIPKGTIATFAAGLAGMAGQAINKAVKKRKGVNEIMKDTGKSRKDSRSQYLKEIEQGVRSAKKGGSVMKAKSLRKTYTRGSGK